MVFGREILAQATGTPVFELMDYSQNHFRFWRDGNDVVVEDLSTNGTVVPIRQTDGVPYDERTQFAGTVDGTRFHSTRRAQLFGFLMAGLLLTALLAAPLDVSAATLVTLDGGGLKALVERGDTLWGILDFAEGGGAAELVVRVKEIARLNNLSNPHLIFPGQEILLRAAVETAPAVTDTVARRHRARPCFGPNGREPGGGRDVRRLACGQRAVDDARGVGPGRRRRRRRVATEILSAAKHDVLKFRHRLVGCGGISRVPGRRAAPRPPRSPKSGRPCPGC
jgi:hypothetical protein